MPPARAESVRLGETGTEGRNQWTWACAFALDYFKLPPEALDFTAQEGQNYLWNLWLQKGDQVYDSPIYALRQEWFHAGTLGRRFPAFFLALPENASLLDYGCGTAEMERLHWIDRKRRTILLDRAGPNWDYVQAKYPNGNVEWIADGRIPEGVDGIICTHVLEHVPRPIDLLRELWESLRPGGQALFWFDTGYPAPGHLPEAIEQYPLYEQFLKKHARLRMGTKHYHWVEKPPRRLWRLWGS